MSSESPGILDLLQQEVLRGEPGSSRQEVLRCQPGSSRQEVLRGEPGSSRQEVLRGEPCSSRQEVLRGQSCACLRTYLSTYPFLHSLERSSVLYLVRPIFPTSRPGLPSGEAWSLMGLPPGEAWPVHIIRYRAGLTTAHRRSKTVTPCANQFMAPVQFCIIELII